MASSSRTIWGLRIVGYTVIAALSTALWISSHPVAFGDDRTAEYQIKAAFIYKFSSYIQWPDTFTGTGESSFTIAVVGADVLAEYLSEMVKGREVEGRPIVVRALEGANEEDLASVQVLFVGSSAEDDAAPALASIKGRPVLTVTESDPSQPDGGVINFVVVDDRVRFDIALTLAEQRRLKISARLLEVARRVLGRTS